MTVDSLKNIFFGRVKNSSYSNCFIIMPQDVSAASCQQKTGKSAGPDGLHMEASYKWKLKVEVEVASRSCKYNLEVEVVVRSCKLKVGSGSCKLTVEISSRIYL